MEEFSKKDLVKMIMSHADENGMVNLETLEKIVFDIKFPDELFKDAVNHIKEYNRLLDESQQLIKEAQQIIERQEIINNELITNENFDITLLDELNDIATKVKEIFESIDKNQSSLRVYRGEIE